MISGYLRIITVLCFSVLMLPVFAGAVSAQEQAVTTTANTLKEVMRAADSVTLMNNNRQTIRLWGIESVPQADAVFYLNARTALANTIGNAAVECEIKSGNKAQCFSANNIDLGLFMVQQGFATVERADVFGTVFEETYIKAEIAAQDSGKGIWSSAGRVDAGQGSSEGQGSLFAILSFVLFLLVAATFTALAIIIMRGFKSVIQAQNDNLEMMGRERHLKNMERGIVATMLDSEMKANKSKIEAFIVVYEEMLRSLRDTSKEAKYKSSGDIVQKQPVLSRSVFDRNTDKLDVLGRKLSSDLIHFYARVKTNPEYVNIEPEMSLTQATEVVQSSVSRAKKLNELIETLLEEFEKSGVMNEIPQE